MLSTSFQSATMPQYRAFAVYIKRKQSLFHLHRKDFNGTDYILGQGLLIYAAEDFVAENGYIVDSELGHDARKILSRFCRNLEEMKTENRQRIDIDREFMFNSLTDLNWLLSSKYYYTQKNLVGKIELLKSSTMIRIWVKKVLEDVIYETALYDEERCKQYESAQLIRYQIFSGVHPDSQVRDLYAKGCTGSDFKNFRGSGS